MSDVFISYASQTRAEARRVAEALRAMGLAVWRDEDDLPPHRPFSEVIEERLQAAKAVVVLWSASAVHSQWVRAEADLARNAGKLVQVSIDGTSPPLPFNQIHSADLSHWRGDARDPHWVKVAESVAALVGATPSAPAAVVQPRKRFWAKSHAGRRAWGVATAAVILVVAASMWIALGPPHTAATAPTAVAVMPFQVESASPDARYFADGLTDTIQSALSTSQIRVVSRTDAGALAGPGAEAAIARLGVRLLLDGTAVIDGKTFNVSVHVDDAVSHLTLWSSHFAGPAENPDALKASVAAATVAVLHCSSDAIAPGGLTDHQVLMLFLQACDLYERAFGDPQAREQLIDALRQVTLRAPRFAPGLAMRAEALVDFADDYSPDQEAALRADARADASRALAIDPTNARAYVAQEGLLPATDLQGKEAILRRALMADSDSEWTNGALGELLATVGRMREAADLLRKANAANPLALDWSAESARMSALAGRAQEASDEAAEVAKAWPNDATARQARLEIAEIQSDWDKAFALLDGGRVEMRAALVAANRSCLEAYKTPTPALRTKARDSALAIAQSGSRELPLVCLARLGFVDDAFTVANLLGPNDLESGQLFEPETANLRRDPRFMELANRIGLTRYWRATGKWPDFCAEPGLPYDCKTEAARLARA